MTIDELIKQLEPLKELTDSPEGEEHPVQIAINTLQKFNQDITQLMQENTGSLRDYNDLAKKFLHLKEQYEAALNMINQQQQAAQRPSTPPPAPPTPIRAPEEAPAPANEEPDAEAS